MDGLHVDETRVFIIRHAEAQKNIEKMHGGGTQDLTDRGVRQLLASIEDLKSVLRNQKTLVFCQKEGRSEKTATIIGKKLNLRPKIAEQIYGVGLGIIADLNEDELRIQYPKVSQILEN